MHPTIPSLILDILQYHIKAYSVQYYIYIYTYMHMYLT